MQEISILLQFAYPMIGYAVDITLWMLQHWYLSGPLLLIQYLMLMELWIIVQGKWYEMPVKVVGGILFIPQDILVNLLLTGLFLDPPSKLLVTDRMSRYKFDGGWGRWVNWYWMRNFRFQFALRLCKILDIPQQKLTGTDHCKQP